MYAEPITNHRSFTRNVPLFDQLTPNQQPNTKLTGNVPYFRTSKYILDQCMPKQQPISKLARSAPLFDSRKPNQRPNTTALTECTFYSNQGTTVVSIHLPSPYAELAWEGRGASCNKAIYFTRCRYPEPVFEVHLCSLLLRTVCTFIWPTDYFARSHALGLYTYPEPPKTHFRSSYTRSSPPTAYDISPTLQTTFGLAFGVTPSSAWQHARTLFQHPLFHLEWGVPYLHLTTAQIIPSLESGAYLHLIECTFRTPLFDLIMCIVPYSDYCGFTCSWAMPKAPDSCICL